MWAGAARATTLKCGCQWKSDICLPAAFAKKVLPCFQQGIFCCFRPACRGVSVSYTHLLANECYAIRPGTLLIIPAGKYHRSFYRPGEASGRFRIRFFPKELTEEAQTALLNLKPVYHVEGTPMVDFFSVKNNLFLGVETVSYTHLLIKVQSG